MFYELSWTVSGLPGGKFMAEAAIKVAMLSHADLFPSGPCLRRDSYFCFPVSATPFPRTLMSTSHPIRLAIGGDHAGFSLKQAVAERFRDQVTVLIDCGTDSSERCDYPDFAVAVSQRDCQRKRR